MIHNPDGRLLLAASMVRRGSRVADIGCDHAYLSVYLVKNKIAKSVIASDIRTGPLEFARKNVAKAGLDDKIELRLQDGLDGISADEADDIVICGMGGNLICDILSGAPWLKNREKNIVLQPMSDSDTVRRWLYKNGFEIKRERAAEDRGHIYSVISAGYTGDCKDIGKTFAVTGGLCENMTRYEAEYLSHERDVLMKRLSGLKASKNAENYSAEINAVEAVISDLNRILEG